MGLCRVSFLVHQTATLLSSTRIISATLSHMHSTQQQSKMTDTVDVHTRQRVVTELLTVEGPSPIQIHRFLGSTCG